MSSNYNSSVVTNGLVMYYDMGNTQKSWKGAPTTNLVTNPTYEANPNATGNEFVQWGDLAPIFNTYGTTGIIYSLSFDLKSKIAGPVLAYMQNGSATKYAFVWKAVNATTAYQRFTINGLSASIQNGAETLATLAFYGVYGSGRIASIKNVQVEINPFATPFINGTRTNTQALLDLTNTNTITTTSLTYASDNTFSFNGTSNRITSASTIFDRTTGQEITVSCWIKPSRLAGQYQIICENRSNDTAVYNWILYQHTTDGAISFHGSAQNKSSYIPTIGVWINVTNTVTSAGVSTLYINGVSNSVVTGYTYGGTPGFLCIGANGNSSEPFQGTISTVKIYNRALSASEIQQNFNALRGRYGI